jgi:hypothetical protein
MAEDDNKKRTAPKGSEPSGAEKKKRKTEFGSPSQVQNVVKAMQEIEDDRAADRSNINVLFNGQRPYTKEEEEKFNININVNWGEGKRIMRDANSQLNNAFMHPGTLFQCSCLEGQIDKRDTWGQVFTKNMHRPLQEGISGRKNFFLLSDRNKSVTLHGIGAMMWMNQFKLMPRFVALEDLLIPTETKCDFSNLRYFAANLYLVIGELIEMAKGENKIKGWNEEMVDQILEGQKDLYNESTPSTWRDQPEAMKQIFFENSGYYYSDAIPKVRCVAFYWQEMDKPNKWYRVIYLKENTGGKIKDIDKKFLFDGTGEPFADDISQIINVQYGDSNFVPPAKYHAVRGLGVDLYAPIETLNRLRCEFVQAAFENLKMYFRIKDPADRARLKQQVLSQYGFIEEGLEIVPQAQRHEINEALVGDAMSQMDSILAQSSSSYVSSPDRGGEKQMTAKEAMIRLNQATALVSAMLQTMYLQEGFYYDELKRRFCDGTSIDPDVKDFQERCIKEGIPAEIVKNAKAWKTTPERVLGGGDKSVAQQQALWLLSVKTMFGPESQQNILRLATQSMLDDPAKALMLVPSVPPQSSSGSRAAEGLFGTMMMGIKTAPVTGVDLLGYTGQLLKMMGAVVQRIQGTDGMGTMTEVVGLATVGQSVTEALKVLAGDPQQKQAVKVFGDGLGKLMNEVKAFGQRLTEKQKAGSLHEAISLSFKDLNPDTKNAVLQMLGLPPSQMSPEQADPKAAKAAQQMQMKGQQHAQNMQQSQQAFDAEQARLNAQVEADLRRKAIETQHDIMHESIKATLDAITRLHEAEHQPKEKASRN